MPPTAKLPGEHRPELQRPTPGRFIGDIPPRSASKSSASRKLRVKQKNDHNACLMTSDGNCWRANEIVVIRHHNRGSGTRQSFRVNSLPTLLRNTPSLPIREILDGLFNGIRK